jgi:hypothetical protein
MSWAKKAHTFIKNRNGYSKGLSFAHERWGKPILEKTYGKTQAAMINVGIKAGLTKLRQSGYGLKRTGMGLKRTGMGRRLKY